MESQSPIITKLINNNLEYVKFNGFAHYFDFKSINENTSHLDVYNVIQDVVNEVHSQDLIPVINELNRILALERIYSDSVIRKSFLKMSSRMYQLLSSNLFSIILLSIISIFILNYVYGNIELFFDSNAQLTISLAISGLTATFVGFGAVFIQLSFDNYKKYYGAYSKKLLFNSIGKEIIYLFVFTNIFALSCAITNEKYKFELVSNHYVNYTDLFLYLTIIFFISFLIILGYKIKYVFDFSLSNRDIENIVESIEYKNVKDAIANSNSFDRTDLALENIENNPIEIIIEITLNYISQNNHKVAEIVMIKLTSHFQLLIKNESPIIEAEASSDISIIYCRIMSKIYDAIHRSSYTDLVSVWYELLRVFNVTASVYNINARALNDL